ncbi:MAG: HisA/HisF-related TIM barrel protein [Spirochaetales bacterium]
MIERGEHRRFTVIPAIDIIDGACVRLRQGDYAQSTRYHDDPARVADEFSRSGAVRLHVVDLDAARGRGRNREVIAAIRKVFPGILEVGGGIRSEEDVQQLLDVGVDRLVAGTVLARDPDEVARWCSRLSAGIIAGIDVRNGVVKVSGWTEDEQLLPSELATRAAEIGCLSVIYTDITVDGTGRGPDVDGAVTIARESGLPVIASGGVGSEEHISLVAEAEPYGVVGVIAGRAVYEGQIDLSAVLRTYPGETASSVRW